MIESTLTEVNTTTEYTYFKFVKVGHKYRFASTSKNQGLNHTELIDKDEINFVQGAGTIVVNDGKWKLADYHSTTLKQAGCKHFITDKVICDELHKLLKKEYDPCLM
jgi:hypothetical protein